MQVKQLLLGVGFILTTDMASAGMSFVATKTETIDGKTVETEYTYIYTTDAISSGTNGLVKIQNLKLNGVKPTILETAGYATKAIKDATFDSSTNTINVVFKKNPGTGVYGLVLDLGLTLVKGTDKINNDADNINPANHLSSTDAETIKGFYVIWVKPEDSAKETGAQLSLTHGLVSGTAVSEKLNITVKSTVETEPLFDEEKVTTDNFVVDDNVGLTQDEKDKDVFRNQDKITTSMQDNKVYFIY